MTTATNNTTCFNKSFALHCSLFHSLSNTNFKANKSLQSYWLITSLHAVVKVILLSLLRTTFVA